MPTFDNKLKGDLKDPIDWKGEASHEAIGAYVKPVKIRYGVPYDLWDVIDGCRGGRQDFFSRRSMTHLDVNL